MVNQIYFHNNKTMNYVLANINYGSGLPLTSEGEGEIYYNTADNTLYLNTGTAGTPSWGAIGGGIWEDSGTLAKLIIARETDFQGERVYLYKGTSDAESTYFDIGATGNLIFHIATGKAVEWQVG